MQPAPPPEETLPDCPACRQPASQGSVRDLSRDVHRGTYVCPAGHLWMTKWHSGGDA